MKEVHHRFREVHCFDGRLSTAMSPLVIESVHKLQDLQRVADTEDNHFCVPWADLLAELLLPWRGSSEDLAHLPLDLMRCCGDKELLLGQHKDPLAATNQICRNGAAQMA